MTINRKLRDLLLLSIKEPNEEQLDQILEDIRIQIGKSKLSEEFARSSLTDMEMIEAVTTYAGSTLMMVVDQGAEEQEVIREVAEEQEVIREVAEEHDIKEFFRAMFNSPFFNNFVHVLALTILALMDKEDTNE